MTKSEVSTQKLVIVKYQTSLDLIVLLLVLFDLKKIVLLL